MDVDGDLWLLLLVKQRAPVHGFFEYVGRCSRGMQLLLALGLRIIVGAQLLLHTIYYACLLLAIALYACFFGLANHPILCP